VQCVILKSVKYDTILALTAAPSSSPKKQSVVLFNNVIFNESQSFLQISPKQMQVTLPACHLRMVYDKNYQTIHTLTAPCLGNITCDFQSTHRKITIQRTQHTFLLLLPHIQNLHNVLLL